jgi:hypothetical protein
MAMTFFSAAAHLHADDVHRGVRPEGLGLQRAWIRSATFS